MNQTPNSNKHKPKFGNKLFNLKSKFSNIIQDAVQKVNAEEKNNVETWDDEITHTPSDNQDTNDNHSFKQDYSTYALSSSQANRKYSDDEDQNEDFYSDKSVKKVKLSTPRTYQKNTYSQPQHHADDAYASSDKPHKKNVRTIIFLILGLLILGLLTVLWFKNNSSRKRVQLAPIGQTYQLEPGNKKLDAPILGQGEISRKMQATGELQNVDFDFSPLITHDIERTPLLPEKIKDKTIQVPHDQSDDLEDIWNDKKTTNEETQKHNQSFLDKPRNFLPPWRRFASEYLPTDGLPSYSVILRYNPNLISVDDLPDGTGYNVALPGFMKYSEPVVRQLRAKNYEILLYLPMDEDGGKISVKPIKFGSAFDVIRQSVAFHTSQLRGDGFVGFMNYGGKKVRTSLPEMNFLMSLMAKTGYLYVDFVQNGQKSLAFASAEGQNVPTVKATNLLESVQTDFPLFINHVKKDGSGIVLIDATPENIVALKQYEHALKSEQVRRIPVSAILKHKILNQPKY